MKQVDILGKLFGSGVRVKLMKFFLLNQETAYSIEDLADRLRLKSRFLKNDITILTKVGFIEPKKFVKLVITKRTSKKKKFKGFVMDKTFPLQEEFRALLIDSGGMHIPDLPGKFGKAGKLKLFIASGVFLKDSDRSMDLLIVGDRLNRAVVDKKVKELESEIGKELRYAVFDTEEFMYRLNMYDKLLRDVLDYPHEKVINKIDHPELRA